MGIGVLIRKACWKHIVWGNYSNIISISDSSFLLSGLWIGDGLVHVVEISKTVFLVASCWLLCGHNWGVVNH